MKKSKLLDIYKALNPQEWRLLLDYVSSSYFNKQEEVVHLCEYLLELAKKDFPPGLTKRENIWQAVFPQQPYTEKQMAYLMSDLLKLVEEFLGYRYWQQHKENQEIAILKAVSERNLTKSYHFRLKKLKKKAALNPKRNAEYHQMVYSIASIEDEFFNAQNIRQENTHLSTQDKALDEYYLQSKLKLYCNMLNQAAVIGTQYELNWPVSPVTRKVEDHLDPITQTYQCLFELLHKKEPDEQLFRQYNLLLAQIHQKTDNEELISFYYFAINYCLNAIKKDHRDYADRLLNLYQTGLSSNNLLVNGELSPWIYKNIIKLSLGLKQFTWVENFILAYTEKLPEKYRHDALYFNLSDLKYHQRAYDEALAHLNQIEFSDIFYKHGTKIMLLKIYFEKQETEAFLNLASSYKLMLIREKGLSGSTLNAYKNFVRFAEKLFKAETNNTAALEKIREEITRTTNINARQWLLEQVGEKTRE